VPLPPPSANPKIAKIEALVPLAHGEYWLWSDADIIAPAGLLRQLHRELAAPATKAVTCTYVIRSPGQLPGMLDALFVNLEFLPGALLLGRKGAQDFTFGAVVLFRAADFRARASWGELRSSLADDFELGRRLERVRLSSCLVETLALCTRWRPALAHYYRWQKTIRWCRPGGFLALLAILPFLGWLAAASIWPSVGWLWTGLVWVWISEAVFARVAFATLGCKLPAGGWLLFLAWPPLRAFTWLAVWLPISVGWGAGRDRWRKAHRNGTGQTS
jgi:ceramide glucosyltransferase